MTPILEPAVVTVMETPASVHYAHEDVKIMQPVFEDLNARVDQLEQALTDLTATAKETREKETRLEEQSKKAQSKMAQMEDRLNAVVSRVDEESKKVQSWMQQEKEVPTAGSPYTKDGSHLDTITQTVKSLTNDVNKLSQRLDQQTTYGHADGVPRGEMDEIPNYASRSVGARILRYGGLTSKIYIDKYGYASRQTVPRTGVLGWVQNLLLPAARLPSPPPTANPPEVVIDVGFPFNA